MSEKLRSKNIKYSRLPIDQSAFRYMDKVFKNMIDLLFLPEESCLLSNK